MLRIFGPEKEKLRGRGKKLHNVMFHNLHSLPNVMRVFKSQRRDGACSMHGREEKCI